MFQMDQQLLQLEDEIIKLVEDLTLEKFTFAREDSFLHEGILDSIDLVQLVLKAEKHFKVRFNSRDFNDRKNLDSIKSFAKLIGEKLY